MVVISIERGLANMTSVKMPFARNENNKLVHISEVENGKKCNCVCLDCGSLLIACNEGLKQQHHFKHAVENECKGEGVIHQAAKQIIRERKQITLSKYIVSASKKDSRGKEHAETKSVVEDGRVMRFDSVQEEIELHGMRVDILAKKGSTPIIIEIFYRHKVNDQKLVKIREANISAIEIDLSDLKQEDIKDWETFWLYINDSQHVQWLYNAKAHHYYLALQELLGKRIREQEEKYGQEEIEKQEQAREELGRALYNLKRPQHREYSESNSRLLLLGRTPLRRAPPLIDQVRLYNGKPKGTQRSSSYQRGQTFGRKKK